MTTSAISAVSLAPDAVYPPLRYSSLNWASESTRPDEVPLIDLNKLNTKRDLADLLEKLMRSGFVSLKSHGISNELLEAQINAHRECFSLSEATRDALRVSAQEVPFVGGFSGFRESNVTNATTKQGKSVFDENIKYYWNSSGNNRSPSEQFSRINDVYTAKMRLIIAMLFKKILQSIQTRFSDFEPESQFHVFEGNADVLCVNLYPGIATEPDADHRLNYHQDMDLMTGLFQIPADNGYIGLHAMVGDRMIAIPPIPGELILNLGEVFCFLTNGLLNACKHGVELSPTIEGSERMSMASFCQPNFQTLMIPHEAINPPMASRHFASMPAYARAVAAKHGVDPSDRESVYAAAKKGMTQAEVLKNFMMEYMPKEKSV